MGFFGRPGKKEFARLMAKAIREAGETAELRYDVKEFSLNADGDPANTF